ncbi:MULTISPECIES: monovalent cation/H+ antiporter subunit A [unclassified Rhizobacter]|uniref:monovalent cation/H+ antiporter subunit A n=1 Tax=unclassified Rhizobacter TaxID=2640088 RepID=UPI0006FD6C4F|nr:MULTISPECIES: monovalent cation/H+ antiporter subunit A [unclassified Rhizobacter]KQU75517.1 cation:proton antiporter [Rhizobacter sp. Root29]KQW06908.1 cation:proton antiporter [Rhizobacter sp. Root1238]KRB18972.1 cation:proton antiporter [Rhizobacter sp. Root16D2]
MSLLFLVLLPFIGSAVAALLPTTARNLESLWAAAIALAIAVQLALLYPDVGAGTVVTERLAWLPSLGIDVVVRLDGFAWMFAMLVSGMGLLVIVYARYYLSPEDPAARFHSLMLGFMGAMLGVVVSGNLVQLVVFWELTSVFSFLLIGYWTHRKDARRGARMAFTVTATGGLALLAGVLLLGHIVGSFELDAVLRAGDVVRAHPLYPLALGLVLLGALTKSAQFPFHFWLPHAMAAPTPVSAYLHSATMVKAGVFLLARLWPVLSGTDEWFWIVGSAGLATLLLGSYAAMFQNDLKGLLAYSTISHLGLITLLLGLNSPLAAVAAVFHMMNHATFKASLFMSVGIIDHESGTRDMRRLDGLFRFMPITGTLAIVACAAMAGVPLLNGFLSKEMFFAETVFVTAHPAVEVGLPAAATLAGVFAVVYSLRFGHDVFFGPPPTDCPRQPHEPVHWMRVPVELLVLACVVVGTLPAWSIGPLLAVAAQPVVGGTLPEYSLAVWHGFNTPLVMSLLATVGGLLVYLRFADRFKQRRARGAPLLQGLDGKRMFENLLARASDGARRLVRRLGTRRLQPQLFAMLLIAGLAGLSSALIVPLAWGDRTRVPATPEFVLLWVIAGACAIGAAMQAKFHRLAALTMLGVVGLALCITFAWFSAPDLALTQLAVEVVTLVLFLLGLRWMPKRVAQDEPRTAERAWGRRGRDLVLAVAIGAGLAALSYALLTRSAPLSISPFFIENALPGGGGTNVVNVMLVDFRAFDTLGEITVLGIVGLTVYALLRRFRPADEAVEPTPQQQASAEAAGADLVDRDGDGDDWLPPYLEVPAVLVRLLLPVAGLFASHLFMRGHNEPGGGFVAGLVVAIAFIAQYMVSGTRWVESRLHLRPRRWIAAGLLIALATGLGSLALGHPFLTTYTAHVTWPLVGEVHLPTAALFDLGVFAVVVGSTLLLLTAIAHQSLRARRRQGLAAAEGRAG